MRTPILRGQYFLAILGVDFKNSCLKIYEKQWSQAGLIGVVLVSIIDVLGQSSAVPTIVLF